MLIAPELYDVGATSRTSPGIRSSIGSSCGISFIGVGSTLTPVSTATFLTASTSSGNVPKAPAIASITPPNTSPNKLLTKPPPCLFIPAVLASSAAICSAFNNPEFKSLVAPNNAFLS